MIRQDEANLGSGAIMKTRVEENADARELTPCSFVPFIRRVNLLGGGLSMMSIKRRRRSSGRNL